MATNINLTIFPSAPFPNRNDFYSSMHPRHFSAPRFFQPPRFPSSLGIIPPRFIRRSNSIPQSIQMNDMRFSERSQTLWRGMLCLENYSVLVQLHFVFGSKQIAQNGLPNQPHIQSSSGAVFPQLNFIRKTFLEPSQVIKTLMKYYSII